MTNVENLWEMFNRYMGNDLWILLLLVSLIIVLCFASAGNKLSIVLSIGLSILLIFNDFVYTQYGKWVEKATFYRFLWMIPVSFIIAYATAKLMRKIPWLTLKALFLAVVLMTAAFAGFSETATYSFALPENELLVDDEILEVSELLKEAAGEKDTDVRYAAFEAGFQMKYRTFDDAVYAAISRQAYLEFQPLEKGEKEWKKYPEESVLICLVNGYGIPGKDQIQKALRAQKVDFVVALATPEIAKALKDAGGQKFGETENYVLFEFT